MSIQNPAGENTGEPRPRMAGRRFTSSTSTQPEAAQSAQDFTSINVCCVRKAAIANALEGFSSAARIGRTSKSGCGMASDCINAGLLPKYRVLIEQLAQKGTAENHLRHGHAGRRHQCAHPHGAVHAALQV